MSATLAGPPAGRRLARRVAALAIARVGAQCLGLVWFLVAARELGETAFGILSTGLALVIVIGGLSDLGTTRTVVRLVADAPEGLRAVFLKAATIRVAAGAVVGAAAVVVVGPFVPDIPRSVLLLSVAVAASSGVTEVGFASLRSVGRVGTEVGLLLGERVAFVIAGIVVLQAGGGPVALLGVYALTNLGSAVVASGVVARLGTGPWRGAPAIFDAEGRRTGGASTLVILGPRVSVVLLILLADAPVVGVFALAQKLPEALGTLGTAVLLPVLPTLRAAYRTSRWSHAVDQAARTLLVVAVVLLPATAVLVLDGRRVLDLLFDAGDRQGAVAALAFLALGAVLWVVRTFGEMVLLAEERAGAYLRSLAIGLTANVLVGIPLVVAHGAAGAALALLVGELVVLGGVAIAIGRDVRRRTASSFAGRRPLAPMGDDADVGQQIGGHLIRDGVEALEHCR